MPMHALVLSTDHTERLKCCVADACVERVMLCDGLVDSLHLVIPIICGPLEDGDLDRPAVAMALHWGAPSHVDWHLLVPSP